MRLTLRALVLAAAASSAAFAVTAYAPEARAQGSLCSEEISLEKTRIKDLGEFIGHETHMKDRLLKNAAGREADAAVKTAQAAKFHAAADKATDPAKKKLLLDFEAFLKASAATDLAAAKDRKAWAATIDAGITAANAELQTHIQYLARLESSCK
jgi:hypothetical protein